jgi:hypothetical protein
VSEFKAILAILNQRLPQQPGIRGAVFNQKNIYVVCIHFFTDLAPSLLSKPDAALPGSERAAAQSPDRASV